MPTTQRLSQQMQMHPTNAAQLQLHRPQLLQRHRSVACYARRTVSGKQGSSPPKRPADSSNKTRSGKTAPVVVKAPPQQQQRQRQQQQHNTSSSSRSARGGPQQRQQKQQKQQQPSTNLGDFFRNTPGLNRLQDGLLILGDAVMVLATELSSERLPLESIPALGGVAVLSWVMAGAVLGDYSAEPDPDANPLSDALGWPIFAAVVNSMITWAVCMVVSIFGFSWLVSNLIVEPEMVLEVARDGMLSPQLEISVALLITMSCWRGMAARLRMQ